MGGINRGCTFFLVVRIAGVAPFVLTGPSAPGKVASNVLVRAYDAAPLLCDGGSCHERQSELPSSHSEQELALYRVNLLSSAVGKTTPRGSDGRRRPKKEMPRHADRV